MESTASRTKNCIFLQSLRFHLFNTSLILILTFTTIMFGFLAIKKPQCICENLNKNSTGDQIIKRSAWGARLALNESNFLNHPVSLLIIAHTAASSCGNFDECKGKIKWIQDYHISSGKFTDIGYNFLIGGAGNVYEGRGWNRTNFIRKESLSICFIGNFFKDELNDKMIGSAKDLINYGILADIISKNYKLIGHNQTSATESPGPNVYKIIKTWPHFDSHFIK